MISNPVTLSIVVPAFNEAANILPLYKEILEQVSPLQLSAFEILIVDDGSTDNTLEVINQISKQDSRVKTISFSKNFGNQNALRAGLEHAQYDLVVSMDADLQQPPSLIKEMIAKHQQGYEIILTKRLDTSYDFRVAAATFFYWLINRISSVSITYGSSDFRMLSRKALNALLLFHEYNTFFRGIIPGLGFKQYTLEYVARDRFSGKSKLSLKKLIQLALNGITSSSVLPLRLSAIAGIMISLVAFIYLVYALYVKLVLQDVVSGWSSLIISVLFLGGVQLIILGILGEYLGKIFFEVKKRPHYLVKTTIGVESKQHPHS